MPAAQGVVKWPSRGPTLSHWLRMRTAAPDAAIDRILLVHALSKPRRGGIVARVWRVLGPAAEFSRSYRTGVACGPGWTRRRSAKDGLIPARS